MGAGKAVNHSARGSRTRTKGTSRVHGGRLVTFRGTFAEDCPIGPVTAVQLSPQPIRLKGIRRHAGPSY